MSKSSKTSGGNRKGGRNREGCKAYRARGTRERNKLLKIARHIKRFPGDSQAQDRLKSITRKAA